MPRVGPLLRMVEHQFRSKPTYGMCRLGSINFDSEGLMRLGYSAAPDFCKNQRLSLRVAL